MVDFTKELLDELYNKKVMSLSEIAEVYHCDKETVRKYMIKFGIPRRSSAESYKKKRMILSKSEVSLSDLDNFRKVLEAYDDIRIKPYKIKEEEVLNLSIPIDLLDKGGDVTLTLVLSDLHLGDANFLPDTFMSCVRNLQTLLNFYKSKLNIKRFNIIVNGDVVSGREVYRFQALRNLLQRGHWQVFLAEVLIKKLVQSLPLKKDIIKIYLCRGTHEELSENYLLYLKVALISIGFDAYYLSHSKVLDIGNPVGHHYIYFTHGFGRGDFPVSYALVKDLYKALAQYKEKDIKINRACVGHSIPGHRYIVTRNKRKRIKVMTIEEFSRLFRKDKFWETPSLDNKGNIIWSKVYNCWSTKTNSPIYKITSLHGEIEVTDGHSVMVYENNMIIPKEAKELKEGDMLVSLNKISRSLEEKYGNNDFLWLLGFYSAEGWVSKHKNHSYTVGFSNSNKQLINKANHIMSKYLQCKGKVFQRKDKVWQVTINSKNAYYYFKHNCENRYGKIVPNKIFNLSEKQIKSYLDGYYIGDGTNSKKDIWNIKTVDKGLLCGITTLLHMINGKSINLGSKYYTRKQRRFTSYYYDDKKNAWRLSWVARLHKGKEFDNYILTPITKIKICKNVPIVYDLEVENTETFVDAHGMILLHNTHWLCTNIYYEGLTIDVTGGFQKWEYTNAQRPAGMILYMFNKGLSVIEVKPDSKVEFTEKNEAALEYKNLVFYGSMLLHHFNEIEGVHLVD